MLWAASAALGQELTESPQKPCLPGEGNEGCIVGKPESLQCPPGKHLSPAGVCEPDAAATPPPPPPPQPPPPPPTKVSTYGAAEAGAAAAEVSKIDNSSTLNQAEASGTAQQVQTSGAQHAARMGAKHCAKGFLEMLVDPVIGGLFLDSCHRAERSADQLHQLEQKQAGNAGKMGSGEFKLKNEAGLTSMRDEDGVFGDLSKKYDVDSGEFIDNVVKHKGDPEKVGEFFGDKIPKGSVNRALTAAGALEEEQRLKLMSENQIPAPGSEAAEAEARALAEAEAARKKAEGENTYNLNAGSSKKIALPTKDSLRDKLSKGLAERALEAQQRSVASRNRAAGPAIGNEKLEPLRDKLLEDAAANNSRELTIFDVVHLKYSEKFQMLEKTR